MNRPLAGVVTGYAGGILLGYYYQPAPALLWCLALLAGLLALGGRRFPTASLSLFAIICGWANLVSHTACLAPDDLRRLLTEQPTALTVRGLLVEAPRVKVVQRKGTETDHTQATVEVTDWRRADGWQPASGRVMATAPTALDARFFPGQRVEVAGVVAPPSPPVAEGLLDYRAYLANQGIYYLLTTRSTNDWHLAPDALKEAPLTQRFMTWSRQTLALGLPALDEPLRLIWAMTLGWRTAFAGDLADPFLQAGTMHLFAIDGLRIALVSGMIVTLLRVLQLPRAGCGLVCLPVIWFYTAATGWEPSAVRASVMMTLIILGWVWRRPGDLLNSLAAAALIILWWDPPELFEAGFQLSFLVVMVIGLMLPPLNAWIDQRLKFDPLVPKALISPWQVRVWQWVRHLLQFSALSLAAWVGSIPLSAKYFNLFSPISPLANVLAVPLGICALSSNLGSLVCGGWFPWATVLFNHSAWLFMLLMTRVSEFTAGWPGAYCYVPAPPWTMIALYYAVVVAWFSGWPWLPPKLWQRLLGLGALVAAIGLGWWAWETAHPKFQLTVLPLNGAQVVFVAGGGQAQPCLINCGNEVSVDATLKPFLRAQGVNHLPRLILTTAEVDSCGGAAHLNQLLRIDALFTSDARARSKIYRDFVDDYDQQRRSHQTLHFQDTVAGWSVLHPGPPDPFTHADDHALVLRGTFFGTTILLLSDLSREGQSALLNRTNDLRAEVVVASPPLQGEPLCAPLLQAIRPHLIIITDGEYPIPRRAGAGLKARLAATGIPVIYTRACGAVTLVARPGSWEASSMAGEKFQFDTP